MPRIMKALRTLAGGGSADQPERKRGNTKPSSITSGRGLEGFGVEAAVGNGSAAGIELSGGRLAGLGLFAILLCWLGWQIIAQHMAVNLAASSPNSALRFVSDEPEALTKIAERELIDVNTGEAKTSGANLDVARHSAEAALRESPLEARALFLLGLVAEGEKDSARAEKLIRLAAKRTWRESLTQLWLYQQDIRQSDFDGALLRLDAVMRVNPTLEWRIFPVLGAFSVYPQPASSLARFFDTDPPWRSSFLEYLSSNAVGHEGLTQLYAKLKSSDHPPTARELRAYVLRLVKDAQFEEARRVWRETLPPSKAKREGVPYNSDFATEPDGFPFDWILAPVQGAQMQIVGDGGTPARQALQIQFSGARVQFEHVSQLMMLTPGKYKFSGRVRADRLDTPRGLVWRVFCADSGVDLGQTDLLAAPLPWTEFAMNFDVPQTGCQAQWLKLVLPGRVPSEFRIDGQVWYESLHIGVAG